MFTWTAKWQGIIFFEKILFPNEWTIKVDFDSHVEDLYEEQIAFDRCRFIVESSFQDSLFINVNDTTFTKLKDTLVGNIITLPEDPTDSTIAVAALSKFISIAEQRIGFDGISISSRLSDNVELHIPAELLSEVPWLVNNPIKSLTGEPAWFMRTNAGITDLWIKGKSKHEIIRDMEEWSKHGLEWNPNENAKHIEEPMAQQIPRPRFAKGWKPKVIDGGKK